MKKLFIGILLVISYLSITACNKDSGNQYIVQYQVSYETRTGYPYAVSFYSDKGEEYFGNLPSTTKICENIGPVSKGFYARLWASASNTGLLNCKILVSKNGGPFLLKASCSVSDWTVLDYTIDF